VKLLLTRPEPDGARTAAALRARGHEVLSAPLLHVEPIGFALPGEAFGGVVMTSANAARAVAGHARRTSLVSLPAFTVGRHTAEAARAAGFRDVRSADGDRHDLAALLRGRIDRAPLLYLAGEDRSGPLDAGGALVLTVAAYRAVKAERFPPAVADALRAGAFEGVLHFSRRTAEAYLDCARGHGLLDCALAPLHYCLSRQVAAALAAAGATAIRIAARPEEEALIELVDDRRSV
jgi:uroporphyrinogen-III synthase